MNRKVKNSRRTATFPPPCGCTSYLNHWEKATKSERPDVCSRLGCTNPVNVGAHVFNCSKESKNDLKIVPLCNKCNNPANNTCFKLNKGIKIPSASKMASC